MKVFQGLLDHHDIETLLQYHYVRDDRTDARPDVISKHPRWNIDNWPQHVIKNILDRVLPLDYQVQEVIFNQSRISFRLHVDSDDGDQQKLGQAVLIPLSVRGPSATVFFDNFWLGASTKFSRTEIAPFEYQLLDQQGQWRSVPDLRILLKACQEDPEQVKDFVVNPEFVRDLEYLIKARSDQALSKTDGRCYDYTNIINFDETLRFDQDLHQQWLSHIPIENLHGLTIHKIVTWNPGDVIVFERQRLHCAASGHDEKIGVTVFTLRS